MQPSQPQPPIQPPAEPAPNPTATPVVPTGTIDASGSPVQPTQPESNDVSADLEPEVKPLWRRFFGFIFSWLIIPGLLVLFVHNFVFQAWYVDGQSMEPSFQNSDYLIVSKWDASIKKLTGQSNKLDVKRGDVLIFNPPGYSSDIYFIKRAIGLPGERVVIKGGIIKIFNTANPNGLTLDEPYTGGILGVIDVDTVVGQGELFVCGDNRNPGASHDSRAIGPIPMDHIVGSASLRLLPVSQLGPIAKPTYETTSSSPSLSPSLSPTPATP
ncbi:MAG: signal peptidase I [bacterium]